MHRSVQRQKAMLIVGSLFAGFGAATLIHAWYPATLLPAWALPASGVLLLAGLATMALGWRSLSVDAPQQSESSATESTPTRIAPPAEPVEPGVPLAAAHAPASQTETPANAPSDPPHLRLEKSTLKIVAIGGGTGMPQLLRGLRAHTDSITAIVTVADDGGSSGRLRRQMGLLPPGDFRNNIAALSDSEDLITRLFQYRFAYATGEKNGDDVASSELAGHSFGNLFIATMAAVTGSFESGLAESSRVLAVRGRVLPSTLEQVHLCAEVRRTIRAQAGDNRAGGEEEEWLQVEGESQIPEAGGQIMRVFLKPAEVRAYPEAIRAILAADLIVAGPGSFFTSIMPNLLVPAVRDAIIASPAPSIYLCNVATQPGETDGYSVSDHMAQLRQHAGDAFTTVLANHTYDLQQQLSVKSQWVPLPAQAQPGQQVDGLLVQDSAHGLPVSYTLFTGDLVDAERPWRHNPQNVAARLVEVCNYILS